MMEGMPYSYMYTACSFSAYILHTRLQYKSIDPKLITVKIIPAFYKIIFITVIGAHSSAVGWGTVLQVGRSRVRFPMVSLEFFIYIYCIVCVYMCTEQLPPGGYPIAVNLLAPEFYI